MKLELKHITHYLPYGLNFRISEGKIFPLNANHIFNNHTGQYKGLERGAKIILRPLSDLSKEVEVNGERFVLADRLFPYGLSEKNIELIFKNPQQVQYWIIQKLFEWHFDVFGLIKSGLAIDINTIN